MAKPFPAGLRKGYVYDGTSLALALMPTVHRERPRSWGSSLLAFKPYSNYCRKAFHIKLSLAVPQDKITLF